MKLMAFRRSDGPRGSISAIRPIPFGPHMARASIEDVVPVKIAHVDCIRVAANDWAVDVVETVQFEEELAAGGDKDVVVEFVLEGCCC